MTSETKRKVLECFAEGRSLYKEQRFSEAGDRFAAALKLDNNDGPSRVYYERCRYYMEHPPSENWDGVLEMKTK